MPRLPRRRDDLLVIAVGEHRAAPPWPGLAFTDRRVQVLGCGDLEALHPPGQRRLVAGLHEQVDVRALDAEVDDVKVLAQRGGERRLADRLVDAAPAQVADRADHPQRDVHGIPRVQERPLLVRRAGPRPLGRPPCPASLAAARLP
ncbi:MAG TPA: hypothetical protein VHW23_37010 [Kofleriaceae bacterium]|jgi:hypothetical protein|nr:hypothetical protein [Kofleriaceae bacterium]